MPGEDLQSLNQSYYPSCKVRLILRFDEFARTDSVSGLAPKKITTKLRGIKDPRSTLDVTQDEHGHYTIGPKADPASPGGPQVQDTSSDNLTHAIGGIIPTTAEICLNGIRVADTAELDFSYVDLPIDPRIVRSCAVEVYLGTVTANDFAAGAQGGVRTSGTGAGDPLNVVPDTFIDANGTTRSNLRFQGWVDEWMIEFNDENEPMVHLKCRDNTQTLIDTDAPPGLVLDMKSPIDSAIATYMSNFPVFAGLSVQYRPGGVTIPTLDGQLGKTAYNATTGGPAPSKGGGTSKLSVWDYLTDIVGAIGHTIRLEGTNIIIQQARTLLGSSSNARPDDPFTGRDVGFFTHNRLFVYGRNLKSLKLGRKFGKAAPKNIEVRSYSHRQKTTLIERFPDSTSPLVTTAQGGDGHSEVQYRVLEISGVENRSTLKLIAQTSFEMFGRNEMTVMMSTENLASFGGDNLDPDILDLKAGDTVDVQINRQDGALSSVNMVDNLFASMAKAKAFLQAVGYSPEFADAAAKATSDAGFQTKFKTKAVTYNWDTDDGVSIDISAANYLEVKVDPKFLDDPPPTDVGGG